MSFAQGLDNLLWLWYTKYESMNRGSGPIAKGTNAMLSGAHKKEAVVEAGPFTSAIAWVLYNRDGGQYPWSLTINFYRGERQDTVADTYTGTYESLGDALTMVANAVRRRNLGDADVHINSQAQPVVVPLSPTAPRRTSCPNCGGLGYSEEGGDCPACKGSGYDWA